MIIKYTPSSFRGKTTYKSLLRSVVKGTKIAIVIVFAAGNPVHTYCETAKTKRIYNHRACITPKVINALNSVIAPSNQFCAPNMVIFAPIY